MVPNKDPKLAEQLSKIWQQSAERLTEQQAARENFGYLDLTKTSIQLDALKLISESQARASSAAVFERRSHEVALAVLDPQSPAIKAAIEELKKQGLVPRVFLVSKSSLEYAWSFYQFITKATASISSRVDIEPAKVLELGKELTSLVRVASAYQKLIIGDPTPGNILEIFISGALTNHASDIHFETGEKTVRLRYRIDGVLQDVITDIAPELYKLLLARIKLLSNLRMNITNVAQDGRFTIGLGEVPVEIRVSVIPSEFGETVVIRILDPRIIQLTIADLGMRQDDRAIAERQLKEPNGMILNTGPTGSGKTTTLYAFLRGVSSTEVKIITIEDPIEYHLKGIEQTQVDARAGYSFSNGLQAIMRQDPDVILVGEIRDQETVGIAIQAALTGHLVFSTLHTNSAAGVIPRLLDLGAPPTSIGPALNLIIAQRLVRKLCEVCRVKKLITPELSKKIERFLAALPARVNKDEFKLIAPSEPPVSKDGQLGCEQCHFTGYKGRIGIFELLEIGEDTEFLINKHASEGEIVKFARERGLVTLQQDGVLKVLRGITSFAEVENVTGPIGEFV